MLNIPEVIKELFKQDGIRKNFRVHFPNGERADLVNKDIIEESVKFTESLCSQQTLKFGLTEASVIEFECVGVENIAGMTIQCGIEIDVSSLSREDRQTYGTRTEDVPFPFYAVPYGVFIVEKCPRQADMKRRRVTGYTRPGVGKVSLGAAQRSKTLAVDADAILAAGWLQELSAYSTFSTAQRFAAGYTTSSQLTLLVSQGNYDIHRYARISVDPSRFFSVLPETDEDWTEALKEADKMIAANVPSGYTRGYPPGVPGAQLTQLFPNTMAGFYASCCAMQTMAVLLSVSNAGVARYSYPLLLEENKINLVDVPGLLASPMYGAAIQVEDLATCELYIGVSNFFPVGIDIISTGRWLYFGDIMESKYRRVAVYGEALPPTDGVDATFTADGKTQLPGLGDYYEFLGGLGADELIDATLETRGSFGSVERGGRTREITLSNDNPEEITPESIASLWFEEYALEPPGSVLYPYLEGSEELIGETFFRDGGGYDMTNNKLLKEEAVRTQDAVREQILASFPENTAKARYTPIDLTIKARPWLEDGDAIRVTTPEGEIIDSYILRHTISGVQHLEDNIEAEGVGE